MLRMFIKEYPPDEGFRGGSVVKYLPANEADVGLVPGSGRSPGEGNSSPLHCSCLDRGAWWVSVHGVTESQKQISY